MFETARRNHLYDPARAGRSAKRIWQGPGSYHVVMLQPGNGEWVGHWSSDKATVGRLARRTDLEEFLDWATHVVDNARRVRMIGDAPVLLYAFHERQMPDHARILGIRGVIADSSGQGDPGWMRIRHTHPFVPDAYVPLGAIDDLGAMDFSDLRADLRELAGQPGAAAPAWASPAPGGDGDMADGEAPDDAGDGAGDGAPA